VQSRDRDVDSVGACVGMKGMRVQSIIRELRGEKIDIIEYSEDSVVFATHALSPAKVSRITILDPLERHMEVIVDDSQLSLAIGKKGQNVRLAAKLLGWKIDIKSEEEKRQEVESQMAALVSPGAPVSVLSDYGLSEELIEKLIPAGVGTIDQLGGMTPEQIEMIPDIGTDAVAKIQEAVNAYYSQFEDPPGAENPEETMPDAEPVAPDMHATPEEAAEIQGTDAASLEIEPGPAAAEEEVEPAPSPLYDPESSEERFEPGSAEAHLNLGVAYKGMAQFDKAMVEYDAAEKLNPELPEIYLDRGIILHRHKDAPERAVVSYKKYISLAGGEAALPSNAPVFALMQEAEQISQVKMEAKHAEEQALVLKAAQRAQQQDARSQEKQQQAPGSSIKDSEPPEAPGKNQPKEKPRK